MYRSGATKVKKLSFGNVLSNIASQDILSTKKKSSKAPLPALSPPKDFEEPAASDATSTSSSVPKDTAESINVRVYAGGSILKLGGTTGKKRNLRWADGKNVDCKLITASAELCKVRYIPAENRKRCGPELGRQVDKGLMPPNYNLAPANELASEPPCSPPRGEEQMDRSRVCTRQDILDKILRWMPQWLEEQKNQREEPEVSYH